MLDQLWAVEASTAGQIVSALRNPSAQVQPTSTVGRTQRGNVAVIEVRGVLSKYPSPLQAIFGGAATSELQDAVQTALADPSVKAVCLVIDSPGGQVAGIPGLADAIYNARQSGKQVVVQVDGMLASAAFYLASGANKIYASNRTDRIGSIGTMAVMQDTSQSAAMQGVSVFVASTGSLKPLGVPGVPITDQMKAYLQANVEASQRDFTAAIQRGRRIKPNLLAGLSDGSMVNATDAVTYGLIDGIQSLETTLAQLQGTSSSNTERKTSGNVINNGSISYVQQFRDGVNALVAQGLNRGEAASRLVRENPELHRAMLNESAGRPVVQVTKGADGKSTGANLAKFREGMAGFMKAGLSRGEAASKFVRENPEIHAAALAEMQAGAR